MNRRRQAFLGLAAILVIGAGILFGVYFKNKRNVSAETTVPGVIPGSLPGEENYEVVPPPINIDAWAVDNSEPEEPPAQP